MLNRVWNFFLAVVIFGSGGITLLSVAFGLKSIHQTFGLVALAVVGASNLIVLLGFASLVDKRQQPHQPSDIVQLPRRARD